MTIACDSCCVAAAAVSGCAPGVELGAGCAEATCVADSPCVAVALDCWSCASAGDAAIPAINAHSAVVPMRHTGETPQRANSRVLFIPLSLSLRHRNDTGVVSEN